MFPPKALHYVLILKQGTINGGHIVPLEITVIEEHVPDGKNEDDEAIRRAIAIRDAIGPLSGDYALYKEINMFGRVADA